MIDFWQAIIVAFIAALPGIITSIINYRRNSIAALTDKVDDIHKDVGLVKEGVQKCLRNQLREIYYDAIQNGFIKDHEFSDFMSTYEIYHRLGKNGEIDSFVEEIKVLHNNQKNK